jgi:hypothetical protein
MESSTFEPKQTTPGASPSSEAITSEEAQISIAPLSLDAPDGGCTTTEFEI